jgi:hypothetical protein
MMTLVRNITFFNGATSAKFALASKSEPCENLVRIKLDVVNTIIASSKMSMKYGGMIERCLQGNAYLRRITI